MTTLLWRFNSVFMYNIKTQTNYQYKKVNVIVLKLMQENKDSALIKHKKRGI